MGIKKFAVLVMALIMCLTAVSAMAANTYTVSDDSDFSRAIDNLQDGDIILLDASFTTNKKIITNKDFTLDLGKNKLTFTSHNHVFNSGADILFKNGSIHLDETANGQGFFSVRGAQFELNGVSVTGDGIGSSYGVFLIESGSSFDIIGCDIEILNDTANSGGLIKVNNGGSKTEAISIKNSSVKYTAKTDVDTVGILTDGDSKVDIENVDLEISGVSSGINVLDDFEISKSQITISDCSERGIKVYEQGSIAAENSEIVLNAPLMFKVAPTDTQIVLNNTSFSSEQIVDNNGKEFSAPAEIVNKAFKVEGMIATIDPNGNVVIGPIPAVDVSALPQTGDNSSLMLWAGMLALAMVGFVASRKTRLN